MVASVNSSSLRRWTCRIYIAIAVVIWSCFSASASELASGVRGLATRAPAQMKIDGDLAEFKDAFCTPVGYFEQDIENRAAQFFYMWDETAFYAGLRTLDKKQANPAPDNQLWEGDGVEWYFDTRRGDNFRAPAGAPAQSTCTGPLTKEMSSSRAGVCDPTCCRPFPARAWKSPPGRPAMGPKSSSSCLGPTFPTSSRPECRDRARRRTVLQRRRRGPTARSPTAARSRCSSRPRRARCSLSSGSTRPTGGSAAR